MQIALFSDIHANLPALEAFFEDIDSRNPDSIYCLGDLVGYNIWPNEVVNAIRAKRIPTIAGNHDVVVGEATDKPSGVFTNSVIGKSETKYLRALPAHIRLDFQLNSGTIKVLLVHGSPIRNNEYLTAETEDAYLLELMEVANCDILCCAHTHKPFHRTIPSGKDFKHVINLGSLGKPKDKDQRGCYAMLSIDEYSDIQKPESIKVAFCRVVYDVEKAARAVEETELLPNKFAEALRIAQ